MKTIRTAVEAILVAALLFPTAAHAASKATIAGAFADSCRDFTAHSSKDISHVEIHHADGLVVKDEAVTTPDYAVDGGPGDEIDVAVVKSGTTTRRFTCESGGAPTAVLEIRLTPACSEPYTSSLGETFYWCTDGQPNDQRTVFVDPGDLRVDLLCDFTTENLPCTTVSFRGTNSTDPDDDIASWSVDFDDGTVATGGWTTTPPNDVTHEYHPRTAMCSNAFCQVTLTVTDAGGRTDTDTVTLVFVDATPD
jgi:hypothetical protein